MQVPPVSTGEFDLACEWSDSTRESAVGPCGATGETVAFEIPTVRFIKKGDPTTGVNLATITVDVCKISSCTLDKRRALVAAPKPYVDGGQFAPDAADWSELMAATSIIGLQVKVDTSAAGFFGSVAYTARIVGARWKTTWDEVLCLDSYVIEERSDSFVLGVIILADAVTKSPFTPLTLTEFVTKRGFPVKQIPVELGWSIAWMGVEGTS